MLFSDMPYVRPDMDLLREKIEEHTEELKNAQSFAEADRAYAALEKAFSGVQTAMTLCYIRHTVNTEDDFYAAEQEYLDEFSPELRQIQQGAQMALYDSAWRPDFERKYGSLLFTNMTIELRSFDPKLIPDMQEENKLVTTYGKLIASAQIPFEGQVLNLAQLGPYKESPDPAMRRKAWLAQAGFYTEHQQELDDIYDKLTALRTKMGRAMGYENFVPLGYDRMGRNCYTEADVKKFREAIVEYVVPVADRLYREQAQRLGVSYPLSYADTAPMFLTGNPKPQGTADDILAAGKKFYHELSPEASTFIDVMFKNELMDVLSRKGKQGGGYCAGIPDYKVPFIFANFNGTQGDVEVLTHEGGHAFAGYTARDVFPLELQSPTLESCEIHSMSMEFFAWPWAEDFFGDQADKYRYAHLAGALTFLPYGTMVDHFQHIVYEQPDLTPEQRHEKWAELTAIYMPWIKLGDMPFWGEGKAWQRQSHIYEAPFYYIDYCLAQSVALQFWALMQADREDAWKRYYDLVKLAGTRTYRELVTSAGLNDPFEPEGLKAACEAAAKWLDGCDMTKIK